MLLSTGAILPALAVPASTRISARLKRVVDHSSPVKMCSLHALRLGPDDPYICRLVCKRSGAPATLTALKSWWGGLAVYSATKSQKSVNSENSPVNLQIRRDTVRSPPSLPAHIRAYDMILSTVIGCRSLMATWWLLTATTPRCSKATSNWSIGLDTSRTRDRDKTYYIYYTADFRPSGAHHQFNNIMYIYRCWDLHGL